MVLFFRHGITPTANKLYQLVRKGSMSAPAEALIRFWETLREKSRIRIEHPDLPDALRDAAGEMVGALWQRAQASAQAALSPLHEQAQAQVLAAEAAAQAAIQRAQDRELALAVVQKSLQTLQQQWMDSQAELGHAQGEVAALQRQVDASVSQRRELQEGFHAAQQRFTHDLEQQRAAVTNGEARHAADMKRLLLDVDRERVNASKYQKELEQVRRSLTEQLELQRQQTTQKQQALDALRQRAGELEGSVAELRGQRDRLSSQLDALRLREEIAPASKTSTKTTLKRSLSNVPSPKRFKRSL